MTRCETSSTASQKADSADAQTKVLFNANCPVCNYEISQYAKYAGDAGLSIRFDDLNSDALEDWHVDADTAAKRLYVRHKGEVLGGIEGFLVLWAQMPKYRWLGRIVGLPGLRQIASFLYDWVLAPVIYRWHLARIAKQARRATAQVAHKATD